MKLLLDTHIWLWSVLEPEQLAPRVAEVLEEPNNELWLSPISAWELTVLVEKGRLVLDRPPGRWIAATAKIDDLTLVTSDDRLLGLDGVKIFGHR